jgi:hypothetical protein
MVLLKTSFVLSDELAFLASFLEYLIFFGTNLSDDTSVCGNCWEATVAYKGVGELLRAVAIDSITNCWTWVTICSCKFRPKKSFCLECSCRSNFQETIDNILATFTCGQSVMHTTNELCMSCNTSFRAFGMFRMRNTRSERFL